MRRLTEYVGKYPHGRPGKTYAEAIESTDVCRGEFEATACVERLAAYEDTGLEPEEIPHWISVSERLPEELGHYLAVVKRIAPDEFGGNGTRIRIMRWLGYDWRYAHHIPEWINQKITETVTHWMPLPAVPKEEK